MPSLFAAMKSIRFRCFYASSRSCGVPARKFGSMVSIHPVGGSDKVIFFLRIHQRTNCLKGGLTFPSNVQRTDVPIFYPLFAILAAGVTAYSSGSSRKFKSRASGCEALEVKVANPTEAWARDNSQVPSGMKIFTGNSNRVLSEKISSHLDIKLGKSLISFNNFELVALFDSLKIIDRKNASQQFC